MLYSTNCLQVINFVSTPGSRQFCVTHLLLGLLYGYMRLALFNSLLVSFSFWLFLVAVNYTKCNLDIVFIIFLKKVVEGLVIVWHLTLILIFEELNLIFGLFFRKLNLVKSVHSVDFKV